MNRIKFLGIVSVFFLLQKIGVSQLTTTGSNSISANALVNNIIGSGVTFSNATYTGKPLASGTFNGVNSNIGLNSGVIITSGRINVAPGPNNNGGATFSNNGPNIPELETLAQSTTFDGAILEFDFIPQSNYISFRYVFASEEYNEYVCSEFNDAFAFFISGPGITGAENLALVPGTSTPVTINTINNGTVGALGSATNSPCILGNSAYFVGNTANTVQYDGWTTVLTAERTVIPCQTYHIRMMIADGADDIFDSAVFLEENSFSSDVYEVTVSTYFNDSSLYEGCTQAEITFSRPDADPTPMVINYNVSGSATAGVDYATLPGSVTIPANQSSVTITIDGIADGLNEGTETLILNAVTACGNIPHIIFIKDKPQIDVFAPNAAICSGQGPVVLTALASGGMAPYSYSWNTGQTGTSISVNPSTETTYTVTATDFCGNTGSSSPIVFVGETPTASIDAPPFICSGAQATISYTGTAPPSATYIWDFDNASSVSSGSDQGPYQVSWESSGIKTISLQVIQNGCSTNVVTTQVLVNPTPTADFVVDPIVCAGQIATVTYTGTGTDGGGYGWGFPGGVIITGGRRGPFQIRWDSVGVFGVTLTVTENGCTSPGNEVFVTVQPTPSSDFSVETPVCVGEASTITYDGDASSTATYNWNFSGGNVLSGSGAGPYEVQWNSPGTKNVFMSVTEAGCSSNITSHNVVVNSIPQASFAIASPICEGQATTATYTGTANNNANYTWDFGIAQVLGGAGQGPYTLQWDNAGTYSVSLVVSRNGCSSPPFTVDVEVFGIPDAPFTAESPVCIGEASSIVFNGTDANGNQYNWDFSGGQILAGNGVGPYEVYWQNPGNKQIVLQLISPQGCASDPAVQVVEVKPTPTSVFTAETPVCLNETSTIQYTGSGSPSAQYSWSFNGGIAVSGSNQGPYEIQWQTPGIKTITVQVEEDGCVSPPTQQQVNVRPLPTGFFTAASPVCAFESTTIVYSGNAAGNAIFNWDFDNGSVISGSGPGPYQVSWETAGPKNIRLVVIENGCSSVEEINVVLVNPVPTTNFTASGPLCLGENSTVVYTGNALSSAQYTWDFDGATVISGAGDGPFVVNWDAPGTRTITLNLSQAGCDAPPFTQTVTIYPIPTAPFLSNERVCVGVPATLTYTGTASSAGNFNWNLDGGVIQSGSGNGPLSVFWNTPGIKQVSLYVEENGCPSPVVQQPVEVIPYPTSDFSATPLVCEGLTTTVTFNGTALPQAIFDWNFDGAEVISGSGGGPYQVTWPVTGDKTITLSVSQFGCASPESQVLLNVAPSPTAFAGDDRIGCPGDTLVLGGLYTSGYAYQWTPSGDFVNATISDPELVLENNSGQLLMNEYIVATTLGNCTVYDTVNVLIEPLPVLTVDMPDGQCFAGNALDFSASGNFQSDAVFTWQFGQFANPPQTNTASPQDVNFLSPGMHVVQVMVETWGCRSPVYIDSVEIYEMPQAQFSATNVEGCPPLRPEFQNTSSGFGNDTYTWEMGEGTTLNGQTPDYSYTSSGQHTVTLTVETAQGCTARYEMHSLVNVFPVPLAGFTVNPNVLTTAQPLANIIDQSVGAASWEYNLGDGTSSNERSFTHNYLNVGSYDLTQIVTNSFGCKDIATYSLKVEPEMTFYLPNAFTPDEDGTNEVFKCYGLNIEQFRMEIYDRWGELVFESNDIEVGWNGRLFNSFDRPVSQMDVYAVVVYVRDSMENPPRRINHRVTLVH